ncbi:MAG TPA: LytTR family DNA-binding domain-containing protein [Blastocatellia bacterium]|nr:LytTR family DNA-binding domain-containing protein [Blastocatellia bacterium]
MTSMKAVLVDNEPTARRILREELELATDVEIVGEADNTPQAIKQIRSLKPDLVFLDLQMPGIGGFDIVRRFDDSVLPCIVIVTTSDQHALKAFEAGAVDYLLKPVAEDRLARCLDRVRLLCRCEATVAESLAKIQSLALTDLAPKPRKIVGRIGEEYFLLQSSEVLAFQAERELVWIITPKQRYLATQSLNVIERKLVGQSFARVHRNSLVNLDHVTKMSPLSSHRWLLTLDNHQEFIVSKRQARAVQQRLSW